MSDVHLEFYDSLEKVMDYITWTESDISSTLILAGDIGISITKTRKECELFVQFLEEMKRRFLNVILITGNHEYYLCKSLKLTMNKIDLHIRNICDRIGVIFLQQDVCVIDDIHIYGCTLFTKLNRVQAWEMNDVKRITSREKLNDVHQTHKEWLNSQRFEGKNIVVTHHVPMIMDNGHTGFYSNTLFDVQMKGPIDYWLCGHTHMNIDKDVGRTKLLSCCIGYPRESEKMEARYFEL